MNWMYIISIDMQDAESLLRQPDTDQQEYVSNCRDPRVHLLSWSPIWDRYQTYYCNQKIKRTLLFQSKKSSAKGRREERREGRKETESGISGHLLKVALQLYLLDLTYIRSQQACCALYIYVYLEYHIYIYTHTKPWSTIFHRTQEHRQVLSFCFGGRRCALVFVLGWILCGYIMSIEHIRACAFVNILLDKCISVQSIQDFQVICWHTHNPDPSPTPHTTFDLTYILHAHSRHVVHHIYLEYHISKYIYIYAYIQRCKPWVPAIFNLQQHTGAQVL